MAETRKDKEGQERTGRDRKRQKGGYNFSSVCTNIVMYVHGRVTVLLMLLVLSHSNNRRLCWVDQSIRAIPQPPSTASSPVFKPSTSGLLAKRSMLWAATTCGLPRDLSQSRAGLRGFAPLLANSCSYYYLHHHSMLPYQ